ncbi:DUF3017 domain-containing protein [Streptomyces goshikiensis]|uniref:DUF3017 domain-containing protein n=1 Tax=Streptomyces goshikiensis TaxID=1942 RepID=UPI003316E291
MRAEREHAGPVAPGAAAKASGAPDASTAAAAAPAGTTAADAVTVAPAPEASPAPEAPAATDAPETPAVPAVTGKAASGGEEGKGGRATRRFPSITRDTARPEGGGRAAPRDASAPARQWPMLSVLAATAVGLLVTAVGHPRVGCLFIGVALIAAAVLRRVLPSVGMLAVRSRFTDMATYGVLGVAITLLALVMQPQPWLDIPSLESAVHFSIR